MRLEKGRRRGRGERVNSALKGGGEGRRGEQWGRKKRERKEREGRGKEGGEKEGGEKEGGEKEDE